MVRLRTQGLISATRPWPSENVCAVSVLAVGLLSPRSSCVLGKKNAALQWQSSQLQLQRTTGKCNNVLKLNNNNNNNKNNNLN